MKKVAVLMSTYNGENYLLDQIESILYQKGDFELSLIVRDDGSTDTTQIILNEYQKKGKLKWYTGENLKPALSFLTLIRDNPGYDYYAFSDQDDYWDMYKIKFGIQAIENKKNPCLYFCNAEFVDKDLNSLGGITYKRKPQLDFYSVLLASGFLGCTMVFNRNLAELIQNKPLPHMASMHDSYTAKVCLANNGQIVFDNNPHMKYRQHGNNVIGSTTNKMDAIRRRVRTINQKAEIGVAEDAKEILRIYNDDITEDTRQWLEQLANYKFSVINSFKLALSRKPKFLSKNLELTIRLSIAMRNF